MRECRLLNKEGRGMKFKLLFKGGGCDYNLYKRSGD
jgi:hypothetical protein